jgi:hypothetical protein
MIVKLRHAHAGRTCFSLQAFRHGMKGWRIASNGAPTGTAQSARARIAIFSTRFDSQPAFGNAKANIPALVALSVDAPQGTAPPLR